MKLVFEDIENLHNFKSCPDVNPSGIKRFTYAPLINATNMFFSFSRTESFLKFIEFNPEVENSNNGLPNPSAFVKETIALTFG